jgi:hypothetical protein
MKRWSLFLAATLAALLTLGWKIQARCFSSRVAQPSDRA